MNLENGKRNCYERRNHSDRDLSQTINELKKVDMNSAQQREEARNMACEANKKLQHYIAIIIIAAIIKRCTTRNTNDLPCIKKAS